MIIRRSDCPSKPWKNGLGSTREIAIQPSNTGLDDFLWRVSIAEVDSAAPFSSFPGIDRQIALLDGNGFTMTLDDDRVHPLTTPFVPFAFAGEAKVTVTLTDGPTRDFNLMVRRAQASADVLAWQEAGSYLLDPTIVLIYAARGAIDTTDGMLHAGDAWLAEESCSGGHIVLRDDALAFAIRVMRKA